MSKKRTERSWEKARNSRRFRLIPKRLGSGVAYPDAKEAMTLLNGEKLWIIKPWRAIFGEAAFHFLMFFIISMMSFHIFLVPAVPLWVIEGYRFFYIFLKKLERFNISKVKFSIFGISIILIEIVASIFLRELIYYIFKVILGYA